MQYWKVNGEQIFNIATSFEFKQRAPHSIEWKIFGYPYGYPCKFLLGIQMDAHRRLCQNKEKLHRTESVKYAIENNSIFQNK